MPVVDLNEESIINTVFLLLSLQLVSSGFGNTLYGMLYREAYTIFFSFNIYRVLRVH